MDARQLQEVCARLGIEFQDPGLLQLALTHRSYSSQNNERLEFLGDAVLGFVIAEILIETFPDAREGQLSRLRAELVKRNALVDLARRFDLGTALLLGPGELKSGGSRRESILCDALEAIIGALYLDQGIAVVRERIAAWYAPAIADLGARRFTKDAKSELQEQMQARGMELPRYRVVHTQGDAHSQWFHVECTVAAEPNPGVGEGPNRRAAEQEAAAQLLERLLAASQPRE